jgi:hypothetical protein
LDANGYVNRLAPSLITFVARLKGVKMNDEIQSNGFFAERKVSKSRVSFNYRPGGYPEQALLYENGTFGLKVRFPALFISESFTVRNDVTGNLMEQPLTVGIILAKGLLKLEIGRRIGSLAPNAETAILNDIYELLLELLRGNPIRGDVDASFHIYEVERLKFWDEIKHGTTHGKYSSQVIQEWPATLVL